MKSPSPKLPRQSPLPSGSAPYQFDLIDAVSFGYGSVWKERAYLFKMMIVPILIKFASMVIIVAQGFEDLPLKQGLILIPAALVEGWLLAQFLRTLVKQERWPIVLDEEPDERTLVYLMNRARGIVACCLVYVLLMLVTFALKSGFDALTVAHIFPAAPEDPAAQDPRMMAMAISLLVIGLWAFRFYWLYIPFSVLVSPSDYLKYIGGFSASFKMMGLFLISSVPLMIVSVVVSNLVASLFELGGDQMHDAGNFFIMLVGSITEIIVSLVVTASMAWSLRGLLPAVAGALPDPEDKDHSDL